MAMTPERRASARRQDAAIQRLYPSLRAWVSQEKNRYIRATADDWRRSRMLSDQLFHAHEEKIKALLYAHYLKVGRIFNQEIQTVMKKDGKPIELKEVSRFEYLLKQWALMEAGRKAKPIAGTTKADINRAVTTAYQSQEPESNVIRAILSTRGYSAFRADAVARTETHNAAMYASQETATEYAQEAEVVILKVWSPSDDERSREFHREMESHPAIPMDALFDVPDKDGVITRMTRPGDPSAPPEQVINCRCVLTYEAQ